MVRTSSGEVLRCRLELPADPVGIVVFVHGSGSGMESPRNRQVAEALQQSHLGTFLVDLLTEKEAERDAVTREHRFNIPMTGERVVACIDAISQHPVLKELPVQLVGSSTGAAAALVAAAARPERVAAVVSRGGRPDLAGDSLPKVRAPTLLIVGSADCDVMKLNEQALARMTSAQAQLTSVSGATHLFEEPGTLKQAATLTARWLTEHAKRPSAAPSATKQEADEFKTDAATTS